MTLVSPETLCEEQGPAVGGVSERCQVKQKVQEQKRTMNQVPPGLMILSLLAAWQVAGNVGHARSMVIGVEAEFETREGVPHLKAPNSCSLSTAPVTQSNSVGWLTPRTAGLRPHTISGIRENIFLKVANCLLPAKTFFFQKFRSVDSFNQMLPMESKSRDKQGGSDRKELKNLQFLRTSWWSSG